MSAPGSNGHAQSVEKGRGPDGRFVAGHRLGGRPRGPDFRAVIAEARGDDAIEQDLLAIYDALLSRAVKGDTQAARLLLDRICDVQPLDVTVTSNLPPGERMTPAERGARIRELLDLAKARMDAADAAADENGEADVAD